MKVLLLPAQWLINYVQNSGHFVTWKINFENGGIQLLPEKPFSHYRFRGKWYGFWLFSRVWVFRHINVAVISPKSYHSYFQLRSIVRIFALISYPNCFHHFFVSSGSSENPWFIIWRNWYFNHFYWDKFGATMPFLLFFMKHRINLLFRFGKGSI